MPSQRPHSLHFQRALLVNWKDDPPDLSSQIRTPTDQHSPCPVFVHLESHGKHTTPMRPFYCLEQFRLAS